jgi:hypothetical protein
MSLSPEESNLISVLSDKLMDHQFQNSVRECYYEGKQRLKDLQISVPPSLRMLNSVVGWAGTAVDVLEERLDFEGWIGGANLGLDTIYRANELDLESSQGHKDALINGVSFVFVGKGMEGEPDPLITIESPKRATAIYDMRTRRPIAALLARFSEKGIVEGGSLYLPNVTIYFALGRNEWLEISRDEHNLGRVPCAPLINNPRSGDPWGRSEITRAVMSITDSAMRTLVGAEISREFFASPQRYILGASEDAFVNQDGEPTTGWSVIQGRVLGIGYNDDDGVMPQVGQFASNSPAPFFDQLRAYAQMLAAETSIPTSYLGLQTDNPASADAIRALENRLVKRAERRQKQFGRTWSEVAKLSLLVRDGVIPAEVNDVRPIWRDASTPTVAASTDAAVKLIQAGVLLPDSEVTYNRLNFSDAEKAQLARDKARAGAGDLVAQLAQAANPTPAP